jgi:DNA-binding response OmpR family regulator
MATILIVEDEGALERIFTKNLRRLGHSVFETRSLAQAEEVMDIDGNAIDLVLLDINLPDGTGWDFIRHWRARRPKMRIIVVTAVPPAQSRMETFPPDAMLVKPFAIESLLALVAETLATPREIPMSSEENHHA